MTNKYSVILVTLAGDGGNVWEKPQEVLETVAAAGYDGVDLDAEPDRSIRKSSTRWPPWPPLWA